MILSTSAVEWAPMPNSLTLTASSSLPAAPHTSVSILLTTESGLLGVLIRKRGWDIPGGHIEAGETAQTALMREVREEAGLYLALNELAVLGYSSLEVMAAKPDDYAYPYPLTHQPIFTAALTDERCRGIRPHLLEESLEARVIPWADVPTVFASRAWLPLALTLAPAGATP